MKGFTNQFIGDEFMVLFGPLIIALFNILTNHTMLTRKRSILYCIISFILNSFIFIVIIIYIKKIITNPIVYKYALYLTASSFIIYISIVFNDSFSIKLFSMLSIWVFSTIILLISNIIYDSLGNLIVNINLVMYITIFLQLVMLIISYRWYGQFFRTILGKIHKDVIHLMSGYTFIALLLLINCVAFKSQGLKNTNSILENLLLIIFIILGYYIVFFGIISSSKNDLLKQNVDDLKIQSDTYYNMANYDALTGIANRHHIINNITKMLDECKNTNEKFILIIFDIDKFKSINDRFGHAVGDTALKFVVNRVKNCLRKDDFIGRLGGDEFIVFTKNIDTKIDAESLIMRIINTLEEPLKISEDLIFIEVSLGVSVFPIDALTVDDLMEKADKAMYIAKKTMGTAYEFNNDF